MSHNFIIWTIGSIPLFSSRIFLPPFLLSLVLLFPHKIGLGIASSQVPDYYNLIVGVFGVLAFIEFLADKSADLQYLISEIEIYAKPLCYFFIELGLLSPELLSLLENINWEEEDNQVQTLMAGVAGGNMLNIAWAIAGCIGVVIFTWFRSSFIGFLESIDEDDDLRIRWMLSYMEDSMVLFGFVLLLYFGLAALILFGFIYAILFLIKRKIEKKLEKQKRTCTNTSCDALVLPFALRCYKCKQNQIHVTGIGIIGQSKKHFITNSTTHQFNLMTQRRCSCCANKLTERAIHQKCQVCEMQAFVNPNSVQYQNFIKQRFFIVLVISFFSGWIPVIGIVATLIVANLYLTAPIRKYLPRRKNAFNKILGKFILLFVILFGSLLGLFVAPLYVIVRYWLNSSSFEKTSIQQAKLMMKAK